MSPGRYFKLEVPAHDQPRTKEQCIASWKSRQRIPVPTKSGKILDMLIVHLVEASAIDGVPIDLVIDARATHRAPIKRFAVVFADYKPSDDYPIPTLWVSDGTGSWLPI